MKAEYLYFWADTFFSWTARDFDEFAELYQDINLPFFGVKLALKQSQITG